MQCVAVTSVARIFLLINSLFLFACQDTASNAESRDFALQQPGAPQSVSASTNNGVVTLSWSGAVAVTPPTYNIYFNQNANVNKSDTKIENILSSPYEISELIQGETYYFVVTTVTELGGESEISIEIPFVVPSAVLVSIELTPADTTIVSGRTIQFKATGVYTNGQSNDVTSLLDWIAEDTQLTVVDNDSVKGFATAQRIGKTNIVATDPISNISGKTTLQAQFDHSTESSLYSCNLCHARPEGHLNSTTVCSACHVSFPLPVEIGPFRWKPFVEVDHIELLGTCIRCHDGALYVGKSPDHINSTEMCGSCHTTDAANAWTVEVIDHTQVVGDCADCHNGVIATGKNMDHINSTDLCDACHANFNAFQPSMGTDHTQVFGVCLDCHNGVIAKGRGIGHVMPSDACDDCHITIRWTISGT